MQSNLPRNAFFIYKHAQVFAKTLDALAEKEKKSCWLEKTPAHVQRILRKKPVLTISVLFGYIEKLVSKNKFIHIIRDGKDVVASLYSVSQKYPETWNGSWDVDKCVQRWLGDTRISYLHACKPNHLIVRYESLVESPESVIRTVCGFLEIPFESTTVENRSTAIKDIVRDREKWKGAVSGSIQRNKSTKFEDIFDDQQIKYITSRLNV